MNFAEKTKNKNQIPVCHEPAERLLRSLPQTTATVPWRPRCRSRPSRAPRSRRPATPPTTPSSTGEMVSARRPRLIQGFFFFSFGLRACTRTALCEFASFVFCVVLVRSDRFFEGHKQHVGVSVGPSRKASREVHKESLVI